MVDKHFDSRHKSFLKQRKSSPLFNAATWHSFYMPALREQGNIKEQHVGAWDASASWILDIFFVSFFLKLFY